VNIPVPAAPPPRQPVDPTVSVSEGTVHDDRSAVPADAPGTDTTITLRTILREVSTPFAGLSGAHQAAVEALPAGSALLVVQQGPTAGARFLLAADRTTAGRHPSSDIFLDDVTVSRKHAEFLRHDGGFVLHDVGGLNGTYVGRERIDQVVLHNGDEVRIGKFRMVYYASRRLPSTPTDRRTTGEASTTPGS
jgi:pSer/pThr/pTyr-binding forkhead associated (FHA) protein